MVLLNKYVIGICSKAAYIEMVTCKKTYGYHTFTIEKPGPVLRGCLRVLSTLKRNQKHPQLKAGYVIFQKRFSKLSQDRVPKQTCSQSAVRGVSTHDVEERAFSEQPSQVTER